LAEDVRIYAAGRAGHAERETERPRDLTEAGADQAEADEPAKSAACDVSWPDRCGGRPHSGGAGGAVLEAAPLALVERCAHRENRQSGRDEPRFRIRDCGAALIVEHDTVVLAHIDRVKRRRQRRRLLAGRFDALEQQPKLSVAM